MTKEKGNRIKVAFFDVDGLLVDSEQMFNRCWVQAAQRLGYPLTSTMALELRSLDSKLAEEKFLLWFHDEIAYSQVRSLRKQIMSEEIAKKPISSKPGVKEIVSYIEGLGIRVAIVTSSTPERANEYLGNAQIGGIITDIVSTNMVSHGKPYPDVYKYACEKYSMKPDQCLVFEDSPNGIISAKKAGCITVMIPDLSPCDESVQPYVDYCFPSLLAFVQENALELIKRFV